MKVFLVLSLSLGLFLSSIVLADQSAETIEDNRNMATFSAFYDEMTDSFALGLGFTNQYMEVEVNFSAEMNKSDKGSNETELLTGAILGIKRSIHHRTYISFGAMGNYGFTSEDDKESSNPYTVGAYIGLAYNHSKNFQTFARIMPISFAGDEENKKSTEFFEEGQIGIKYLL